MVIVTGPGRRSTSFVASVYRELGFDPLGEWRVDANSGFEAPEVLKQTTINTM